ncbi:MAG: hypothetical protein ACSW8C_01555 [bacterium]
MAEVSLNNSQVQMDGGYIGSASEISETAKGQLGAQEVIASTDVDPTTKDDECASVFQAEKNTKKAQKKKDKEKSKTKLNELQKIKENQNINEQDQRNRRITKNTAMQLASISQLVSRDLSETIQERSQKLFDGSEKTYQKCFEELEQATLEKTCTPDKIAKTIGQLEDIAEQHNALQIIIDVWERKLTNLKGLAQSLPTEKELDAEARQQDQEALQQQIAELENNLDTVKQVQTDLMARNGARIEDSYTLAPLLREATAHYTHDITLPPKSFNELILDKILPLRGDPAKTFDCLTQSLIEGLNPSSGSAIEHFTHNVDVVKTCLTQELQCCPDKAVATAILNTLRGVQKLGTVQDLNVSLVTKLSTVVPLEILTS